MEIKEVEEKVKNVYALNTKEERAAFFRYADKVPVDGTIVDIGTCGGGSAFVFAFGSKPSVKVYTIDPVKNEKFLSLLEEFELSDKLIYLEKPGEVVAKGFKEKIDLLFIDGIHSYPGVMNDFNWFKKYMVKDGIVIFHDYYLYKNTIGLAVDELREKGLIEEIEIIDSLYKDEIRTGLYIARVI